MKRKQTEEANSDSIIEGANYYKLGFWSMSVLFLLTSTYILFRDPQELDTLLNNEITGEQEMATASTQEKLNESEEKINLQIVEATEESKSEAESETFDNRCTNDIHGYSLQYSQGIFTDYETEEDRCKYFSFIPFFISEVDKKTDIPIQLKWETQNYQSLADNITSSLSEVSSSKFDLDDGLNAMLVTGIWPAESLLSGSHFTAVVIESDPANTLSIQLNGNRSEEETQQFKQIVRTVHFL